MIKTETIKISNQVFHIDQDGYNLLERYLKEIQTYFSKYDDSEEIVSDIENSIADKLNRRRNNQSDVIHANAVKEVIDSVGSVNEIAKALKDEEVSEVTLWNRVKSFNRTAGRKIISTIQKIGRPAKFIIGLFLALGFGAAFIGLTIALITVLLNLDSPLIDEGFKQIFFDGSLNYYFILVYAGLILPVIVFLLWGLSLATKKNFLPQSLSIGLISIWILIVIAIGGTSFKVFGDVYQRIKANPGVITTTQREIDFEEDIKFVKIGTSNYSISQVDIREATDGNEKIVISTLNRNFGKYNFEIEGDVLEVSIDLEEFNDYCLMCNDQNTYISIYVNDLEKVELDYAPRTYINNSLAANAEVYVNGGEGGLIDNTKYPLANMKLVMSNNGLMDVNGKYANFEISALEGNHVTLVGEYENVKANIGGGSSFLATSETISQLVDRALYQPNVRQINGTYGQLLIKNLELNLDNQSFAEVTVNDSLKANLTNQSNLRYNFAGTPEFVKDDSSIIITFDEAVKEEIEMQYGGNYLDDVVINE